MVPQLLLQRIDALLSEKEHIIIAIDGSCAAGKTTLAAALARSYDCPVIPMDSFFLRPEQRTAQRLAQPGGNVDYERFADEVLTPLKKGLSFSYLPFVCAKMCLGTPIRVEPGRLTVIEGSYSHHPYFQDPYDLKVFLRVSPEVREERILRRPEALQQRFFNQWIPMEQRYFQAFSIESRADLILSTE